MPTIDVEYQEVNAYLRHYSSLRFVMVSVYFAVSAAVVSAAFGIVISDPKWNPLFSEVLRVLGLGTTIVFLMYELRLEQLIRYYQGRACGLESTLPYETMTRRPKSDRMFRSTKLLYAMFLVFWAGAIIQVFWSA